MRWQAYPPGTVTTTENGRQRATAHRSGTDWTRLPGTDQSSRVLYGRSERPTLEDGYDATVGLRLLPDGGLRIISISISPSSHYLRNDGSEVERQPEDDIYSPVNSAAWSLIKITDIRRTIAQVDRDVTELAPRLREQVEELTAKAKRRPDTEAAHARQAEQVLDAMAASQGNRYRAELRDMFPKEWDYKDGTIKQRVFRLRQDDWLPGGDEFGRPGPRLIAWRQQHTEDQPPTEEAD